MAVSSRQSELFTGEDWTVLYRAFTQINFNASDPPSINAALRNYIQVNYPEDFNDWIEQSEFVAIIDLLSWLAGNLAFKTDIAVRENFIDTAQARESILRLARFLSYDASRCQPASGVVKLVSIATDDNVIDSFGNDLSNTQILWNDPDNVNWYEQFVDILNSAFVGTNPFGIPLVQGTVQNIATQLYRINGLMSVNHMGFSASISGTGMAFELCNGNFTNGGLIFEQLPSPVAAFNIFYLNDSNGNGSNRTGFFMLFKQGVTGVQSFVIGQPIANQLLDLASGNINETDVWVQTVDDNGNVLTNWTEIPIMLDSNITYNNLPANQRNIFSVITRDNDQVTLRFSDGLFGNAPAGNIQVTYRVSNGLSYIMNPLDINNVQISFIYLNGQGVQHTLYLTFSLLESVSNSTMAESIESIRQRAPQVYATQNRMVSGEDYNSFPLQTNLAVRIKALNRVYSGQSRYIDLSDPTGTYQDLSLFEEDGIFFREEADSYTEVPTSLNYTPSNIVSLFIQPMISSYQMASAVRDIYMQNILNGNIVAPANVVWNQSLALLFNTTGWFSGTSSPALASAANLIVVGAQLQFQLPNGKTQWASVIEASNITIIPVGITNGPVTLTEVIPTGSVILNILPAFVSAFSTATSVLMNIKLSQNLSFALTYDYSGGNWNVVNPVNNLGLGVLTGTQILLVSVNYIPGGGSLTGFWRITGRGINYVFESISHVEFFDDGVRAIDQNTGDTSTDSLAILKVNQDRNNPLGRALLTNYDLTIADIWFYPDGTVEPRRTSVVFTDSFGYGYPDEPDTYYKIIDNTESYNQYLFWYTLGGNVLDYPYDSTNTVPSGILIGYDNDTVMNADTSQALNTEAFMINSSVSSLLNNTFWTYTAVVVANSVVNQWVQDFSQSWDYEIGRGPNVVGTWVTANLVSNVPYGDELAFHWVHNAPTDHRIDPSITNIHDIFVLTYSYDTAVRQWILNGTVGAVPLPPTELDLSLAFASMEEFRMFSDAIVWRPVQYKFLFGNGADVTSQANFKVIRLPNAALADGEIITLIISSINTYFGISYWDFGETFYFTELAAYIHQQLAGMIASIVIVPTNAAGTFGNDFEITCNPNEIFISTATVANVQIITANTPANLRIR